MKYAKQLDSKQQNTKTLLLRFVPFLTDLKFNDHVFENALGIACNRHWLFKWSVVCLYT